MEGTVEVNGANLWYQITGEGEPVVQIHGAGFGHFNFAPGDTGARPSTSRSSTTTCAATGSPTGRCSTTTWRSGPTTSPACWTRSSIDAAHVHGTSMGGMIAIVFAGKYPERTTSVVINCAAAKLGHGGPARLQELDRHRAHGPGRAGQPHPRGADRLAGAVEGLPRDAGRRRPRSTRSSRSCATRTGSRCSPPRARRCATWTSRDWLPRITSPALVLGGDEDLMTPWDQGPAAPARRRSTRGSRAPRST